MSKKHKRKSTYLRRFKKPLIRGKFYKVSDSNGGHYSRIYRKNTKKNRYWIVRFTSSPGRHRTKLRHQINPKKEGESYVINNPSVEKYENLYKKEKSSRTFYHPIKEVELLKGNHKYWKQNSFL